RGAEIAGIESGFVGVEEREDAEDLVVERAFKNGPADAMAETAPFSPGFFQHAIESFQGKRTAWRTERSTENTCGIEIGGNEHRVPRDVHRFVNERRGTREPRGAQLPLWFGDGRADAGFIEAELVRAGLCR